MTQGRYDRSRGRDEPRGSFDRNSRDERGFFDRARDEVSSWFGDDAADSRRSADDRFDDDRFGRERGYESMEREPRYRDEGYRRTYTGRGGARSGFGDDFGRPAMSRDRDFERGGSQREFGQRDFGQRDSGRREFQITGRHDPDYSQWRSRQIDELDRDYDEFRRENQSRFDREFSTWRGERQAKRRLLGKVTEQMDVVGSDGETIGKVDWIKGDKVVLTKTDSADGRHHAISCSMVDRVEDGKLFLTQTAEEMRREFTRNDRNRALFEPDGERDDGPHMLNRSFSGTY